MPLFEDFLQQLESMHTNQEYNSVIFVKTLINTRCTIMLVGEPVKTPSRAERYLKVLSLVVLVLALIVSQSVRPARALTVSTFVGTTYINEHFRMEIAPQSAVVYDLSGSLLVQKNVLVNREGEFRELGSAP